MRTRDRTKKDFDRWVKQTGDPQFLDLIRRGGANRYQTSIKRACEAFKLDHKSVSDREIAFGILAQILFPNALRVDASRRRGRPRKWDDPDARRQLMRDIDKAWKDKSPRPSIPKLADLLQEQFPKKKEYNKIERETLISQLRKVLPLLRQGV
jgi:hypothetical protein